MRIGTTPHPVILQAMQRWGLSWTTVRHLEHPRIDPLRAWWTSEPMFDIWFNPIIMSFYTSGYKIIRCAVWDRDR